MAAAADRPPRKPISNAARGAYYKKRSKTWLEAQGYITWDMEKRHNIYAMKGGKPVLVHSVMKDQLGADLGAMTMDEDGAGLPEGSGLIVFVQVKGGATARSGLAAARRKFREFPFPHICKRHIHVWLPRARAPEIIDCSAEEYDPCAEPSKRSSPGF